MARKSLFIAAALIMVHRIGAAYATDSSVPFVNADAVHAQGFTGQDVTVAIIDTGIDRHHPALAGSIAPGGVSFDGGGPIFDNGDDPYNTGEFRHGTYMASIITDSSGVAPNANILSVRVFGGSGFTDLNDVRLAIQYVVQRRGIDATIHVINLSLGGDFLQCPCDIADQFLIDLASDISDGLANQIVTFAATGNEASCGAIAAPACVSSAVKVAAAYDAFYPFTNFGDCGDLNPQPYWVTCFSNITDNCENLLAAPGYDITLWLGSPGNQFSGDGTSQATAHCSGVAALMYSKCPNLAGAAARDIIVNTAMNVDWAFPYCSLPPEPRHANALAALNSLPPCATPGGGKGAKLHNLTEENR